MNDLVWSKVYDDYREKAETELSQRGYEQGASMVSHARSVWAGPDKVSCTYSMMHCAKPKGGSEKRMYRWQTVESWGFRRLSSGIFLPYRSVREPEPSKNKPWRNTTPYMVFDMLNSKFFFSSDDEQSNHFKNACASYLSIRDLSDVYPSAYDHGISKYMGMPWLLRGFYRAGNMEEFTARVFGKTRTDKKLVKAVAKSSPEVVGIAHQMRGLVEIKSIRKWIEMNDKDEFDPMFSIPLLRPVFIHINSESLNNFIKNPINKKDKYALNSFWFKNNQNRQILINKLDKNKVLPDFESLASVV